MMTIQQIWASFWLSTSTVNKIVCQFLLNKSKFSSSRRLPWKLKKSTAIVKTIEKFVENNEYLYTSKEVQYEINKNLGIFVPVHIIRDILK